MVAAGADAALVARQVYQSRPLASLRLEGAAVGRMRLNAAGSVAMSWVAREDFERFGAAAADAEPLVDALRSLAGVRVACMLREQDGAVRGSLRAKDDTDVAAVAGLFGGGGHRAAAGFTLEVPLEEATAQVAAALERAFRKTAGFREAGRLGPVLGGGHRQTGGHELARRGEPLPRRLRRERVGHTGTLGPAGFRRAARVRGAGHPPGVLPDRARQALPREHRVRRGGTDTDDAAGAVTRTGEAPARLRDERFAREFVEGLVGRHRQMPPVYSAIKVQGEKACDAARKGRIIDLAPRDIEVYDARLEGVFSVADAPEASSTASVPGEPAGARNGEVPGSRVALVPGVQVVWDVAFHVSKGTYIRSLARDAGAALGCPAHVAALARTQVGGLALEECVSLEALGRLARARRSTRCACWVCASRIWTRRRSARFPTAARSTRQRAAVRAAARVRGG